jgi:hypothetical protein
MNKFGSLINPPLGSSPVSIKIRVNTGCYHRSCCPNAYAIIDKKIEALDKSSRQFIIEEHENGPEILVCLVVATAGVTLAKSIIDLITTIIKARFDGAKKGDRHPDPVELIIRRVEKNGEFHEEKILRIGQTNQIDGRKIETALKKAAYKLLKNHDNKKKS